MSTQDDLAKLERLAIVTEGALRDVLQEILPLLRLVGTWIAVPSSGSAVCRYKDDGSREYEVRYQVGDVGNLVHEMTHVAVNESYCLDFINYPNFSSAVNAPQRDLDSMGRCKNEDLRQTRQMSHSMNAGEDDRLQALMKWAEASKELTDAQRNQVMQKLMYGRQNPQKESHTVMNQVLVWLFEWGFPIKGVHRQKPVVNAFYEELSKAVKEAYESRRNAKTWTATQALMKSRAKARRVAMGYDD